jgi:uncharacterized protein YfaS (alpha-2-macroglobulin family)
VTGRAAPGAVDAYLYTDRGIYRPGETVQLVTLLRDRVGRSIDTMPVTIVLRRPDGLEYRRFPLSAGQTGGFHLPIPISAAASRELWSAEALVDAGGSAVGRVEFDVDDFVPQRLKVTLDNTLKVLHPADTLDLGFDGQFLYGAPAAGLNGEAEIKISADAAPFANYKAYRFGLVDETFKDVAGPLEMGASDGSGKSRVTGSPPNIDKTSLPLKATISAGLFEPGGRLTKDQITVPFRTHAVLLGIKPRFGDDRVNEGSDAVVDVLAFDDAGAPVPLKGLRYRFIYEQRSYDWYYQGSRWDYHYSVIDQPIRSGTVDIDGKAPATLSQLGVLPAGGRGPGHRRHVERALPRRLAVHGGIGRYAGQGSGRDRPGELCCRRHHTGQDQAALCRRSSGHRGDRSNLRSPQHHGAGRGCDDRH